MTILLGLGFLLLGTVTVIFAQNIWNFTGAIDFVESKFPGNTKAFIQLVGVILILLGILFITGLASSVTGPISDTLSKVTGH